MQFDNLVQTFFEPLDDFEQDISLQIKTGNQSILDNLYTRLRRNVLIFATEHPLKHRVRDKDKDNKIKSDINYESHRKFIQFYSLPNIFVKKPKSDACPLVNFWIHIFNVYVSLKVITILIAQVLFQRALNRWHPQVRPGANRTEYCALKADIYEPDESARRNCDVLHTFLDLIAFKSIESAQLLVYSFLAMIIVVGFLYLGAIRQGSARLYNDSMSFHLEPIEEKSRIKLQLVRIVQSMCRGSDYAIGKQLSVYECRPQKLLHHTNSLEASRHTNPLLETPAKPLSSRSVRIANSRFGHSYETCSCSCSLDSRDRLNFVRLIFKERLVDWVRPSNMTYQFHTKLTKRYHMFLIITVFVLLIVGITLVFTSQMEEIDANVRERIKQVKCELWNQNSALICDSYWMQKRPLDRDDKQTYLGYINGTHDSWARLGVIEVRYSVTWTMLLTITEAFITYLITSIWFFDYFWTFSLSCMYSFEWIRNIDAQMTNCIKVMEYHQEHLAYVNDLESRFNHKLDQQRLDDERFNLTKILTITYLNFELFRQHYKSFRELMNFLTFFLFSISLNNSLVSYLVVANYDRDVIIIWIINIVFVLVLNVFVSSCVYLISHIEKLYKSMITISIKSSHVSMENSQIINLWRRQMLKQTEIMNSYCIQLLGNKFTFSTLIAIDSYIVALWLTIGRFL